MSKKRLLPIEMMIDQACGFNPNDHVHATGDLQTSDLQTQTVLDVCNATVKWLDSIGDDPECIGSDELRMALYEAASKLKKLGW